MADISYLRHIQVFNRMIEKTKFEKYSDKIAYSGDIVSKTIAIEKKIVNLTPEDNQKNNVLNR